MKAVEDIPKEQHAFGRRDAEADHAQLQHPHLLKLPHGRLVGPVDLLDLFQKQLPGVGGVDPGGGAVEQDGPDGRLEIL